MFSGKLLSKWNAHYRSVTCLTLSDDESMLISGSVDGSIRVWSLLMYWFLCLASLGTLFSKIIFFLVLFDVWAGCLMKLGKRQWGICMSIVSQNIVCEWLMLFLVMDYATPSLYHRLRIALARSGMSLLFTLKFVDSKWYNGSLFWKLKYLLSHSIVVPGQSSICVPSISLALI